MIVGGMVGVRVGVGASVAVGVDVTVGEGDGEGIGVAVGAGTAVAVAVAEGDGGGGVCEGVTDATVPSCDGRGPNNRSSPMVAAAITAMPIHRNSRWRRA